MSIKVLLADDHEIVREGLRSLIEKESDMEVVGEAADGRGAVELAQKLLPDVVVMDVTMPRLNGIEATERIIGECGTIKVLALSIHSNRRFVTDMLKAGVSGYMLKECAFDELVHAIHAVAEGQMYLSPKVTSVVIKDYIENGPGTESPASSGLTERECKVLRLLADGRSTKEIAANMGVSSKTIDAVRRQMMNKLGIHTIAQLTKYAIREGLSSLDG